MLRLSARSICTIKAIQITAMNNNFLQYPAGPVALKMVVSIGIGMLVGMERKWSHKEAGIRTFAIVALLGMLSTLVNQNFILVSMIGVFILIAGMNVRSLLADESLETTTSVALLVDYLLGVLVGLGHMFTPVAGGIIMTMLLAWKIELNRFAGGLLPSEIRSAILLGLIGFVVYPLLPDRYIDPWQLFNPSDAWISIIAIAGIGFINYVFLRVFSTSGLYWGAVFGGLVNSSATVAELSTRTQASGLTSKVTSLCLLTTIAMFTRNLIIASLFSPGSITATFLPLLVMSFVAGLFVWYDKMYDGRISGAPPTLTLDSPISVKKVFVFGALFIIIQISGILLTNIFGNFGLIATSIFGGLVSSASTTAAAATLASHHRISPSLAGSVTIISSLASSLVNLPIVWRTVNEKAIVKKLTVKMLIVIAIGVIVVAIDNIFRFPEILVK